MIRFDFTGIRKSDPLAVMSFIGSGFGLILLLLMSILGYVLEAYWPLFLNSVYPQLLLVFGAFTVLGLLSIRKILVKKQQGILYALVSVAFSGFSILFILIVKIID